MKGYLLTFMTLLIYAFIVLVNWAFRGTDVIIGVIFPTSEDTASINHAPKGWLPVSGARKDQFLTSYCCYEDIWVVNCDRSSLESDFRLEFYHLGLKNVN